MADKKQRKLTDAERNKIREAAEAIREMPNWDSLSMSLSYWAGVWENLRDMADHGTTDGKSYVEPVPEIGEGYRVATDADNGRKDVEVWDTRNQAWMVRVWSGTDLVASNTYRVPVDRIPTDDDARERRPLVIVQHYKNAPTHKVKLLAVVDKRFVCANDSGEIGVFAICRFPYKGE